ncbi:MAG: glycosyltransferase family 4 protein [Nitrospirae bacterium]|nr:glycosyltransferase family 4 protein [Nitrospirota bacterium]
MTIFYPVPESMWGVRARFIQIINTAHALAKAGAAVKLITGRPGQPSQLGGLTQEDALLSHYGLSRHPNLEIVFLPMIRKAEGRWAVPFSIGMVFNAALLWYLFRQNKKDSVIFVRHLKTAQFLLRLRRLHRIPLVFEAHEIFHLTTEKTRKRQRMNRQERNVYTAAGAIIAITGRLRADIVTMFSLEGIPSITIPDAVRGDIFEIALPYEQSRRRYIFYAGGFYRWKGIDLLIEAMGRLPGETLVVAGGGPGLKRLNELRELAASMGLAGRVNFVGQLSHTDVLKYMREAKIAVVPNLAESVSLYSSPLKMFEYMALNCPIAASDIPGVREILTGGKDAVFFTPGDVQSLVAALRTLIDNPEAAGKIAAAGQELAKNFTYEKRAERIIDFLGITFYN